MRKQIQSFLIGFKQAVTQGSGVYLIPRHDNTVTMSHLGITKKNVEEILLSLSVEDYSSGPDDDRSGSGQIWVFGKVIRGENIYIKLKLVDVDGKKLAKCISFHIASYPIKYPYRTSE